MKRLFLIAILIITTATVMAQPTPTTHCFVEGEEPLFLDHYRAEGGRFRPCVLFAFGGGFSHGDRADARYMPYFERLLAEGFDVVSIDYRLGMTYATDENYDVGIIDGVTAMYRSVNYAAEDVLRATDYIHRNAVKMGIDISKLVVSGSSAGAIAVLQAENYLVNRKRYAKIISADYNYAGVIAFAGAIYSVLGAPSWDEKPCPMMLFHGNSDSNVPYYKATILATGCYGSAYLVEQLEKMGASYHFHSAVYRDHAMAEEPMTKNLDEIVEFLRRCVLNKEVCRKVNRVVDPTIEPQQTEFSVQDYLNVNYN